MRWPVENGKEAERCAHERSVSSEFVSITRGKSVGAPGVASARRPRAGSRRIVVAGQHPRTRLSCRIMNATPTASIVLVHGGFVDGSGWRPLYDVLTQDGYQVSVVQNPTLSLQGDAAATRLIIDAQDGPVVLVGHSYGGAVISEAGTDPKVAALVYVCAFAPDRDESVNTLIAGFPADGPQPPILPPRDGFLFLDREEVPRLVRGRCASRGGRLHGRFAGPMGPGGSGRGRHRPGVADQAELVPGYHRRSDDPPGRPADHVPAGRVDRGGGGSQSLRVRLATGRRRRRHQAGGVGDSRTSVSGRRPPEYNFSRGRIRANLASGTSGWPPG